MRRWTGFGPAAITLATALACSGGTATETAVPVPETPPPTPSKVGETIGSVAWFETSGPQCQWQVHDFLTRTPPIVEPVAGRTLAVLDAPCPDAGGVGFFVNPTKDRAIVWIGGDVDWIAWQADLTTGAATRLPVRKDAKSFGFAGDGSVLAFGYDMSEPLKEGWNHVFHFEGREIPSEIQDGLPALAIAWKLEGDQWKAVEAKPTSTGWDYAQEETGLDAYRLAAGVRSADIVGQFNGEVPWTPADENTGKKLTSLAHIPPDFADGEWQVVKQDGKYLAWYAFNAEFLVSSAPAYWDRGNGWEALPDLPYKVGDGVDYAWKGRLVMVTQYGQTPMFWDTATGALVASSPRASTATFWPPTDPVRSRGE